MTDRVTEPSQQERVLCFDAKTGEPVWSHAYDAVYRIQYTAGPRACVTIDGGRAYSLGAMGHLFCFDATKGNVLWQKDLGQEYEIRMPIWGIACSPLVEKDLVIVVAGGENACLVAFDKTTGEERWKALDDRAQYSSPIVVEQAGRRVLVCWTGDNVVGVNPQTGEVYWKHPMKPVQMPIGVATPVTDGRRVFVSSFYDGSLMLGLREDKPAVEEIWRKRGRDEQHTDALHSMISTPVLDGEHVYGVDSYGELRCLDAKTGERIWESQRPRRRRGGATFTSCGMSRGCESGQTAHVRSVCDVQRARRFDLCPIDAEGLRGAQPHEADRADDRSAWPARRRVLVAPGVCRQARVCAERQGAGVRESGGGMRGEVSCVAPVLPCFAAQNTATQRLICYADHSGRG